MYGKRVHEAVIRAGARISGATVHIVDEEYDHGAIVAQWPVPVLEGDTAESLAARILTVEHRLLPDVVAAFAAGDLITNQGWTLLSTGGTARVLREADIPVTPIAEFTRFPEILSGRVKTLHPAVHAGLLARLSVEDDVRDLERHQLSPIGLVAVNLYPFRETVARPDESRSEGVLPHGDLRRRGRRVSARE